MLLYVILFTEEMYRARIRRAPIVLYIDDSISHQKIQLIFSKKVREKFSYHPEKKLPDHGACITGKIVNQNGGSQSLLIMKNKSNQKIEPLDVFI
jgi:hypothetical protein